LCGITIGCGFDLLGLQSEQLFLRPAMLDRMHLRLRGPDLRQRLRGLTLRIGGIQLYQELSFFDVIAFLHQKSFDHGSGGRMRFKVIDRFNFSIRRDEAPDIAARNF
jgi:hypothetical protein